MSSPADLPLPARQPLARPMSLSLERLIVAITFLSLLAMATRVAADSDTWWHLRTGAWMVEHGRIITHDAFSHTFAGQSYLYPAWLTQVFMFLTYQAAGYAGLNLFTALSVTLAFGLVYAACPGSVYLRAAAVLLAAAASAVFWAARPHIVSLVLAAAFLLVLRRSRTGSLRGLLWLPPLMALWANTHPGFAVGFILIALTAAGQAAAALLGAASWRPVAWLAAIGLACLAALLVSPYGLGNMLYPFQTVTIGALQTNIQEWQSPNFHMREAQVFIVLWLATLAALGFSRRPLALPDLFLLSGAFALALLAGRNIALFALVAPPVLASHGQALLDDLRPHQPRLVHLLEGRSARPLRRAALVNWTLLALVTLAALLKIAIPLSPDVNQRLAARGMPTGAADYLSAAQPAGPMFNPYQWGGYLAWRLYPDYPVYVDGRTDLYGQDFLQDYIRLAAAPPDWSELMTERGVRLLLVEAGSPLAAQAAQHPAWSELYADDTARLFELRH